jgi:hypothetical protein
LNRGFEKVGIAYTSRPQPGTDARAEASRKRRADAYVKSSGKRGKVPAKKKAAPLKVTLSRAKSGSKRSSDTELSLAKPLKKTRKFALAPSTVPASGSDGAGASSSRAPAAPVTKASTLDTPPPPRGCH